MSDDCRSPDADVPINGTQDRSRNVEPQDDPSPFDLSRCRAPQDFATSGGTRKTKLCVAGTNRPPKDRFIRTHPFEMTHGHEEWCLHVLFFQYAEEGQIGTENYLVISGTDAYSELYERLRPGLIVLGVTNSGSEFLWELVLPTAAAERRARQWHETRLQCAMKAQETWLRPKADMTAGGYLYEEPLAKLPDPQWSGVSFETLFQLAYRDRIIESSEHAVVKEYLGA